jgi:hypothetical protein
LLSSHLSPICLSASASASTTRLHDKLLIRSASLITDKDKASVLREARAPAGNTGARQSPYPYLGEDPTQDCPVEFAAPLTAKQTSPDTVLRLCHISSPRPHQSTSCLTLSTTRHQPRRKCHDPRLPQPTRVVMPMHFPSRQVPSCYRPKQLQTRTRHRHPSSLLLRRLSLSKSLSNSSMMVQSRCDHPLATAWATYDLLPPARVLNTTKIRLPTRTAMALLLASA